MILQTAAIVPCGTRLPLSWHQINDLLQGNSTLRFRAETGNHSGYRLYMAT
jgi:hypothetical protein